VKLRKPCGKPTYSLVLETAGPFGAVACAPQSSCELTFYLHSCSDMSNRVCSKSLSSHQRLGTLCEIRLLSAELMGSASQVQQERKSRHSAHMQ
jgi:hypothetical protein